MVSLSQQVAQRGPLLRLDAWLRDLLARTDQQLPHLVRPTVDYGAEFLADLGGPFVAGPVLAAAAGLAAWRARRAGAARWWITLPAAALVALLIPLLVIPSKMYFARPGPGGAPLLPGDWGWYPSGHTATACIAYGTAALLLARTGAGPRARLALGTGTAVVGLAVGFGLLWSDYHWFVDVLGSWCLSGTVLWGLARWLPNLRRAPTR